MPSVESPRGLGEAVWLLRTILVKGPEEMSLPLNVVWARSMSNWMSAPLTPLRSKARVSPDLSSKAGTFL